jgi:hypothetical protein
MISENVLEHWNNCEKKEPRITAKLFFVICHSSFVRSLICPVSFRLVVKKLEKLRRYWFSALLHHTSYISHHTSLTSSVAITP